MNKINKNYAGWSAEGDPIHGFADESTEATDKINKNYAGWSAEGDPIHGYYDGNPDEVAEAIRKIEENQEKRAKRDKMAKTAMHETSRTNEEESPDYIDNTTTIKMEETPLDGEVVKTERDKFTEQDLTLRKVYEDAMDIRDSVKEPGTPRYRLMSVAAVEMKKIDQPNQSEERVKKINQELEEITKKAFGKDEMDKYAWEALTATQMYISEILIGDNSEKVSIGMTEAIANQNGAIGKDPEKYNNLVVIRWLQNDLNHVFVFSPKEDTGLYALVDDSMQDSWKDRFLIAGAIKGKERNKVIFGKHENSSSPYQHEISFEKMVENILKDKAVYILNSDKSSEEKQEELNEISNTLGKLAHVKARNMEMRSDPGGDKRKLDEEAEKVES